MDELRFAFCVALLVTILFVIIPIETIDATSHQIWGEHNDQKYGKGSWCEKAFHNENDKFMREQMNARSDYCYVIVGMWMVIVSLFDCRRKFCMNFQSHNQKTNTDEVPRTRTEYYLHHKNDVKIVAPDTCSQHELLGEESKDGFPKEPDNSKNSSPDENEEEGVGNHVEDDHDYIEEEIPNAILNFPQIGLVNGIVNICHGFGSFFNHACQCRAGGTADVAAMMAVMCFPILYMPVLLAMGSSTTRTTPQSNMLIQSIVLIPTIGQPVLMILFWTVRATRFDGSAFTIMATAFGSHVLFLTYLHWKNKRTNKRPPCSYGRCQKLKVHYFVIAVAGFLIGYLFWYLDRKKIWCSKNPALHGLQLGHVLWHFLTAGSILFLYLLYRTEVIIERRKV